jgi:3-oxoacyl-[acyl-carrier protein] reductase
MKLDQQRALITGGSEGIGRSIAEAFRARGAKVAITGRREDLLRKTAEEIGALAIPGDVAVEADVRRTAETFLREFGGIDILVNNAGIGYGALIQDIDIEKFSRVMAVNVTGAMLMTREVAPHFIGQKRGHVVNISSTAGTKGFAHGTTYCASKFALKGMTECWRDELRRHNIRVILVNPSEIQTGWGGRDLSEGFNPKKLRPQDVADAIVGALEIDDRGFIPEFSLFATNPF